MFKKLVLMLALATSASVNAGISDFIDTAAEYVNPKKVGGNIATCFTDTTKTEKAILALALFACIRQEILLGEPVKKLVVGALDHKWNILNKIPFFTKISQAIWGYKSANHAKLVVKVDVEPKAEVEKTA